jgi:hypothetical protein
MKISQIFSLGKSQAELDFVDIDVDYDTPLFIDPSFLAKRQDRWSIDASRTISHFFELVLDLLKNDKIKEAKVYFDYLHEPNSTCLGLSRGKPRGRGVGKDNTDAIFNSIIKSKAVKTGLIQDIEDNIIFVEDFGKDKLSDMTTNIIRKHLIEYTQAQCNLHNIPLNKDVPSGYYWDIADADWTNIYTEMLVIQGRVILLIPKGIVSYKSEYVPEKYYDHFVLNFLENEQLKLNTVLVQRRANGTRYVTKKSLKNKYPNSKEFLRDFTLKHPAVFKKFKSQTKYKSLDNADFESRDIEKICRILIEELKKINAGNDDATKYHNLIKGILELIFYPNLINPIKETEIHQGRKRIDITFDNASIIGIFKRLSDNMKIPCQFIMVECKNYSSDPKNPELDQLSGRFSQNRGKVGFLVCRTIDDMELFIDRCIDTYKDDRGLIIPLVDKDLITILENIKMIDDSYIERFLSYRIRIITLS